VRLLLDTHILLWWLSDDQQLPPAARGAISSPDNEVMVSAAAVWEIAIKKAVGRLEAPDDLGRCSPLAILKLWRSQPHTLCWQAAWHLIIPILSTE